MCIVYFALLHKMSSLHMTGSSVLLDISDTFQCFLALKKVRNKKIMHPCLIEIIIITFAPLINHP
jgi:hypothetical protein